MVSISHWLCSLTAKRSVSSKFVCFSHFCFFNEVISRSQLVPPTCIVTANAAAQYSAHRPSSCLSNQFPRRERKQRQFSKPHLNKRVVESVLEITLKILPAIVSQIKDIFISSFFVAMTLILVCPSVQTMSVWHFHPRLSVIEQVAIVLDHAAYKLQTLPLILNIAQLIKTNKCIQFINDL